MDFDWSNQYKVYYSIPSYFFRLENYHEGLINEHIMKSTFGMKSHNEIIKEIIYWFNNCVGAYSEIEYD